MAQLTQIQHDELVASLDKLSHLADNAAEHLRDQNSVAGPIGAASFNWQALLAIIVQVIQAIAPLLPGGEPTPNVPVPPAPPAN